MKVSTEFQDAIVYQFKIGMWTSLGIVKSVNIITTESIDVTFFDDKKTYGFLYNESSDTFQHLN